jgi:hypothetical protein
MLTANFSQKKFTFNYNSKKDARKPETEFSIMESYLGKIQNQSKCGVYVNSKTAYESVSEPLPPIDPALYANTQEGKRAKRQAEIENSKMDNSIRAEKAICDAKYLEGYANLQMIFTPDCAVAVRLDAILNEESPDPWTTYQRAWKHIVDEYKPNSESDRLHYLTLLKSLKDCDRGTLNFVSNYKRISDILQKLGASPTPAQHHDNLKEQIKNPYLKSYVNTYAMAFKEEEPFVFVPLAPTVLVPVITPEQQNEALQQQQNAWANSIKRPWQCLLCQLQSHVAEFPDEDIMASHPAASANEARKKRKPGNEKASKQGSSVPSHQVAQQLLIATFPADFDYGKPHGKCTRLCSKCCRWEQEGATGRNCRSFTCLLCKELLPIDYHHCTRRVVAKKDGSKSSKVSQSSSRDKPRDRSRSRDRGPDRRDARSGHHRSDDASRSKKDAPRTKYEPPRDSESSSSAPNVQQALKLAAKAINLVSRSPERSSPRARSPERKSSHKRSSSEDSSSN